MKVEIVQPDEVDKDEFLTCANSAFQGRSTSGNELEWKWAHNGFGRPTIVVARDERGRLLGSLVFGAMRLSGPKGPVSARLSYDTFVVPDARGQGVFGRMLREAPGALLDCDIAFNFPNEGSARGFRHSGWVPVQRVPQYSSFVIPGRGGQVHDAEPGSLVDAPILSFSVGASAFGWIPNASHVDWRLRRPVLETRLLQESDVIALVSVHHRGGIRELRALQTWGRTTPWTNVFTSIGRMARVLKCRLATYPVAGAELPGRLRLGVHGWVSRPSHAELYVWNGSSPGACDHPWIVSGGMFHTW